MGDTMSAHTSVIGQDLPEGKAEGIIRIEIKKDIPLHAETGVAVLYEGLQIETSFLKDYP